MVINVTSDTEHFRIVLDCTQKFSGHAPIKIDRDATTAKHKTHFVNTPEDWVYIGNFTPLETEVGVEVETYKSYKDIKIMPENINEKVIIVYTLSSDYNEPEGFIKNLTVVLQPKDSN